MVKDNEKINTHSPFLPFIVAIICLALGYFIISPKVTSLYELNTQIAAKQKDTANLQEKIDNLTNLKLKFEQSSDDVDLLKMVLASSDQQPEIINQLTAIASKSGMEIKAIKPYDMQVTGSTSIMVTLKGDYAGLIVFCSNLEKNIRPAAIKSVNLTSSKQEDQNYFEASLIINFFTNQNKNKTTNTSDTTSSGDNI